MSEKETKEEIMARMKARQNAKLRPKRIKNFIIYTVITLGLVLLIQYKFNNLIFGVFGS